MTDVERPPASRQQPQPAARTMPNDPVLAFIYDPAVSRLVSDGDDRWPYSRLSGSRKAKIAYKLIVLRCAQLGIEPPTRSEAQEWHRGR